MSSMSTKTVSLLLFSSMASLSVSSNATPTANLFIILSRLSSSGSLIFFFWNSLIINLFILLKFLFDAFLSSTPLINGTI